ncbi:MAG: type I DNA topoisomerase [Paludibacteraceae bacterium]|nr:type I DNA topoisomerase [Paludibacteraceae bacterium]
MQKNLVIVESPAKAKTIGNFLGEGYAVTSSMGHVRDLKKKGLGIDVKNNYQPDYEISSDKVKLVSELKKAAKGADKVLLASDEDREGESIAWHLYEVLGLKPDNYERIVFHEITKTAITEAVANPRKIDMALVNAQQARRVLDRIVGFEISPILWRKVKPSLSAGRVQSVTVRLMVDREREIKAFNSQAFYKVTAIFSLTDADGKAQHLKTELNSQLKSKQEAIDFLEKCKSASFAIEDVVKKPVVRHPAPPFTTSTLQQEAARKLGFSVSKTMMVAQHLYESGKITYMRTDSVNLSGLAVNTCKEQIVGEYGEKYHQFRNYHTTAKGAQEAHEAIRPTYVNKTSVEGNNDEKRLYELIWKRTVASQMVDAQLESTTITISISGDSRKFAASGEVVVFDGFLKVYMEGVDDAEDDNNTLLPPVKVGQELQMPDSIEALQRYTRPPYRYNEASLVKQLETLGIGRPSTYAPTISTVIAREYVVKEDVPGEERACNHLVLKGGKIADEDKKEVFGAEHGKLRPTDLGTVVNDFLLANFPNIMDYNFTAEEEKNFDEIAAGNEEWTKAIDKFYKDFHPTVLNVSEQEGPKVGERQVGVEPNTGKPVFVKIGRFGPVAQIGSADDEEKPRFAPLRKDQHLDTITFEEVMDLFRLPRQIGEYEGKVLTVAEGRFGPYVRHDGSFFSLKKTDDPMTITAERAIELIEEKRLAEKNKIISDFVAEGIQVCNGRYGAYIAYNGANYKIPKGKVAQDLTAADCQEIIKEQGDKKPAKRFGAKKTAAAAKPAATKTTATKTATKSTAAKKTTAKSASAKK